MNETVLQWITGLALIVIELTITTIVGLIIKSKWDKRQKEKEELERLREEQRIRADNSRCELVKTTIHEEMEDLAEDFKKELAPISQDMDLMKRTMQKDVRRSLRQDGKMYCDRGYASQQEKTEFDELYWAYHNLGRNGVVDSLHDRVMQLPDEPERRDN